MQHLMVMGHGEKMFGVLAVRVRSFEFWFCLKTGDRAQEKRE